MNKSTVDNEQMKLYIENQNEILRELQKIFMENLDHHTDNLGRINNCFSYLHVNADSSTDSFVETKGRNFYTPVVEDLLMEMNRKEFDKNSDINCYRCRHFLNIPQNLFKTFDGISNCTKEYEDNLTFVQAVVWLKMRIKFIKDISTEQFYLAFHKQWNNNKEKGKGTQCYNLRSSFEVEGSINESINLATTFNANEENNIISDSEFECANTVNLVCNVNEKKEHGNKQYTKQYDKYFTKKANCSFMFDSESSESSCNNSNQNKDTSNQYIIPDSGSEYSSSSDIFKENEETHNKKEHKSLKGNYFVIKEPLEVISLTSSCSDFLQNIFLEGESGSSTNSDQESCSKHQQNVDHLQKDKFRQFLELNTKPITECIDGKDSNFSISCSIHTKQIDTINSPPEDSAYETYPLCGKTSPLQNKDIEFFTDQNVDITTPCQKTDITNNADSLEILSINSNLEDWYLDQDQESSSSSMKSFLEAKYQQNTCSQKVENWIESLKYVDEHESVDCTSVENVKKERKISCQLVSYTLDALNVNDTAFQAVKVILSIFRDEKIVEQYMRKRYWKDSLEAQAVNTILDFRDVFETENKSDICTYEILQTIRNVLDRSIENMELNKVTVSIHEMSIILELCTSMPICIETINYLIERVNSQESVLILLLNNKKANIYSIINQLHAIFYALSLCLQKYLLVFSNKTNGEFKEEIIPSVADLWKKQSKFESIVLEESIHTREQRWCAILNNFAAITIESFPQFAEKSRRMSNIIART
ncbi:uncharacterized protein LOC143182657 [Calliopsis andreniformis]|uniref:uncharacterized protein LOC143182657 n=1 Tax=Calliopsis andreniformis TaxID=337506 RepID=UPI003FCC41EA